MSQVYTGVRRDTGINMTEGNPIGLLVRFAIPMMIGNIFQQLYNVVDAAAVGKFVGSDEVPLVYAQTEEQSDRGFRAVGKRVLAKEIIRCYYQLGFGRSLIFYSCYSPKRRTIR